MYLSYILSDEDTWIFNYFEVLKALQALTFKEPEPKLQQCLIRYRTKHASLFLRNLRFALWSDISDKFDPEDLLERVSFHTDKMALEQKVDVIDTEMCLQMKKQVTWDEFSEVALMYFEDTSYIEHPNLKAFSVHFVRSKPKAANRLRLLGGKMVLGTSPRVEEANLRWALAYPDDSES